MAVWRRFLLLLVVLPFTDSSLSRSVLVREGADAVLTCPNVEPGQSLCRKTTWAFVPADGSPTVELIGLGQIGSRVSELLSERLTLIEQCGLRIQHVCPQEAGTFQCDQYEREGGSFISQSIVHLSVVSLTEEEEEQSEKLRCAVSSLFSGVTVKLLLQGRVMDKDNPSLQQISQKEVVLTLDHFFRHNKRLFKCEVTVGDQTEVFSFERENSKSRDQTTTNPTDAPDTKDTDDSGLKDWHWAAGAGVVVLVVLVVVLIFWRRLRAKPQGPNTAPQVRDTAPQVRDTAPQVSDTAPQVRDTAPQTEPDDGVSYATVSYNRKQGLEIRESEEEEAVTYSSVRINASGESLYATVNKPKPADLNKLIKSN